MKYTRLWFVAMIVGAILSGEPERVEPVTVSSFYFQNMSLEETDGDGYVPLPPQQEWRSFLHQKRGTWREDCK